MTSHISHFTYHHITVGGTFDHFHKGHRSLLEKAFTVGQKVYLGITTDFFTKAKASSVQGLASSYEDRKSEVEDYLKRRDWLDRVEIIPIEDRFGTTLTDEHLEAIIVSPETELVATEINLLRAQINWSALEVILVPWVLAQDNKPINSVRIRNGEIDREGSLFVLPENWGVRRLPETLRSQLQKPFGELLKDTSKNHEEAVRLVIRSWELGVRSQELGVSNQESGVRSQKLGVSVLKLSPNSYQLTPVFITVGDAVTDAFLKMGVTPDISIVDLKIQRKQVYQNVSELGFRDIKVIKKVKNAAGTLSYKSLNALNSLIRNEAKPAVLQIEGEEDLMTLFSVFLAPLGSLIVYGQPTLISPSFSKRGQGGVRSGIVVVEVTEEKKSQVKKLLSQFKP